MNDIHNFQKLAALVKAGNTDWQAYGRVNVREEGDLLLFDYKNEVQYAGDWNWFELQARGLIMQKSTGEIVALPFSKFFNWGETDFSSDADLDSITEKLDGSLGIVFWDSDRGDWRVTTRGSFNSEQARWATAFLKAHFVIPDQYRTYTFLVEIIYPANRIVVSYGDTENLYLIGIRQPLTLADLTWAEIEQINLDVGFPMPNVFVNTTIEALMEERKALKANREGWVVRFADGQRFKIKGDEYLSLHKLLTGISYKWVLDHMRAGTLEDILALIPDEFLTDVFAYRDAINVRMQNIYDQVENAWHAYIASLSEEEKLERNRGVFARFIRTRYLELSPYMFQRFDGKLNDAFILRMIDPSGEESIATRDI